MIDIQNPADILPQNATHVTLKMPQNAATTIQIFKIFRGRTPEPPFKKLCLYIYLVQATPLTLAGPLFESRRRHWVKVHWWNLSSIKYHVCWSTLENFTQIDNSTANLPQIDNNESWKGGAGIERHDVMTLWNMVIFDNDDLRRIFISCPI